VIDVVRCNRETGHVYGVAGPDGGGNRAVVQEREHIPRGEDRRVQNLQMIGAEMIPVLVADD
jgi:hypothetical protein